MAPSPKRHFLPLWVDKKGLTSDVIQEGYARVSHNKNLGI